MSVRERSSPPAAVSDEAGRRDEAFAQECREVLALAAEVVQAVGEDSRRLAERLKQRVAALPGRWPGARVQELLQRLLDDPQLGAHPDGAGDPLRRALVTTQQRLGYPWALEVHPDDLAHLAPALSRGAPGSAARALTVFTAVLALLFDAAGVGLCLDVLRRHPDAVLVVGAAFAALGVAHAVAAIIAAATASRKNLERSRTALGRLAWCWVLGPVGAVAALLALPAYGGLALVAGLLAATPSMAVAGLCALTAWRLKPEEPTAGPPKSSPG